MARLTLECQALLFDVDGVLVDSRAVVERIWTLWAKRHGVDSHGIVARAHGRRTIETIQELAPHLDAEAEKAWLESAELQDTADLVALPGARAALEAVQEERRALVTSGGRELALTRMKAAALVIPLVTVTAEDVQNGKPAPDCYLLAAERLGFDPTDTVVIEDTPAGVAAGRAARSAVIALTTTFQPLALADATVIVGTLADIRIVREPACLRIEVGKT